MKKKVYMDVLSIKEEKNLSQTELIQYYKKLRDYCSNRKLEVTTRGALTIASKLKKTAPGFFQLAVLYSQHAHKDKEDMAASKLVMTAYLSKSRSNVMFPEGTWKLMENRLMLPVKWGIIEVAKESVGQIVPTDLEYSREQKKCFVRFGEPRVVSTDDSKAEVITALRDTMATWYYLLMEKYGKTTREELLDGFDTADDAWESYMAMHTGCVKYYDKEIELCADYRPKNIVRPEDVWQSVVNIKNVHAGNITHIIYAKKIVEREKRRNFQHIF